MMQVVPYSEKYCVYGPNMERLYVYKFSGYEQSEILVSKKLVSKAELKKTMEKINNDLESRFASRFAKRNIILDKLYKKKISKAKANKELKELEEKKPQNWKDILYDKFGLRQLVVDREGWIGSML